MLYTSQTCLSSPAKTRPAATSRVLAFAPLAFALICAWPVLAQEGSADPAAEESSAESARPDDRFTEEIVVTARRREENVQEIPVSTTAFTQSMLDERSATRLQDLAAATPNLNLTSGSFGADSSDAVVFLRGVGQGDTAVFSDPGVGIYLDGIYLARAQGSLLDLVDLERVEVLRGPQGTLFGKNTTGGAIQLITRRPAHELETRLRLTAGSRNRADGQLSVEGRLGGDLYGSLAAYSANRDGYSRSLTTGKKFDDEGRNLLRTSLDYAPQGSLRAYVTADYLREKGNGGNQALVALTNTPVLQFFNQVMSEQGFTPYDSRFLVSDPTTSFSAAERVGDPSLEGDVFGVSVDLSYQLGKVLLRSLSGYRQVDYEAFVDADGSPVQVSEGDFHRRQNQISEELQLHGSSDKVDWLVGAIYFRERPREDNREFTISGLYAALELAPGPIYAPPGLPNFLCSPGPPPPGLPCFGGAGNPFNFAFFQGNGIVADIDLENESTALFGESTWHLSDRFSVTLGGRYTNDRKSFTYVSRNGFDLVDNNLENHDSWSDFSGRISLAYQLRPEVLIYGNLSRGFKSGGFNGRPQTRGVLDPFDPEIVVSTEVGLKSDLFDRRLRLNLAAFSSDYRDIHFGASLSGSNGEILFVTQNAGDAEIRGVELEFELHPALGWLFSGTAAYLDTELTKVDPDSEVGISRGNRLAKSPEWTASAALQKSFVVGDASALIARADWSWTDAFFNDLANSPGIAQDAYGLLSARLSYGPYTSRWEVSLFGTNLTDEEYFRSGFVATAFGPSLALPGPPREWGVATAFRF